MSSSLFFGQRLCLEEFKEGKSKINSKGKIIFSGHGNTIEIYRFLHQKDCPSSFELLSTLNVFSSTKSSVQKIIFLENKALCCVGERECEILQLQEQKDENCLEFIVQQRFNLYYNDWLIGAKCVDGTGVVLHFATNSIKFIDLSNPSNIQTKCELSLKGRSVITCSLLDGDSWESLQIFAGTCFGPINQFWPAKNGEEILRTFEGNNGMSFAIRRHLNWLFSVGDDRSLRVWIIQGNGLQIFEKYGHGARPFALEIFEKHKTIFTGGVDEYLCIWRWTEDFNHKMLDLNLVKRIEFGSDSLGTIQCILPIFRNSINDFHLNLLISSRRGALVNIPLSDGHYSNKESKHIFEQVLNLNAFVVAEGKKSLHSLMLFALDEFRQLFVCQFSPASQKFPWTLNRLTSLSNKINSELLIDDKEFRPDLSIYSQKVQLLSVCSQNFLFILKVFPINKQIFDFSFVRFDGNFAQILWINSDSSIEDCCYLFALEYNGKATLFKCYSTGSCVIFNTFSMRPPTGRKSFPQSALLISSQKILILGTRSGALLAFSIEQPNDKLLFSLGNAHGNDTVTSLELDKNNNFEFCSLGRDGNIKRWRFNFNNVTNKTKFSFELISFSKLNFEWPCEIIKNNGHSLIAGFQNNDFILFDELTNSIICRKHLFGGVKRLWQLLRVYLEDEKICLFYAQKGSFYCDILKPLFLNFIKSVPHSENITTLASLPLDGGENFFIVSGSLDRRIVCSSLNENKVFKINCSVQMHRSSVETICVLQENQNVTHNQEEGALAEPTYLILSGGGRSELFCCKLILNEENIPQFNLLFSAELKNENNIDDVRVLSVNWIFGKKFAVVLCSDATIRILHLNYLTKSINEFNRFQLSSLAMFCAMNLAKMIKGNDENYRYLFSVTSSGYLYIFKFLLTSNGTKINLINEPFLVEKCGLSAISSEISISSNFQYYILIGSESGSISILTFDFILGNIEINIFVNWHASTITALKIWTSTETEESLLIASIALDCRLCIGNFFPNKNELIPFKQICLSISDPAALLILPRTRKELGETEQIRSKNKKCFNCIISGSGLECVDI
ncbi:hypothetical protein ACQ4LE_007569 [Meloidogyne hapla]